MDREHSDNPTNKYVEMGENKERTAYSIEKSLRWPHNGWFVWRKE